MTPSECLLAFFGGVTFAFWVGYQLGHSSKSQDIAKAIRAHQAICEKCGDVLPFLADGDLYRCSSCLTGREVPAIRGRITTTKPPPEE